MAQQAGLIEIAIGKLQCLLAYNLSFNWTDVKVGDSALRYKAAYCKCTARWRGPAVTLDTPDAGSTVTPQSRKSVVGRHFVRRQVYVRGGAGGADWNPASESPDSLAGLPSVALGGTPGGDRLFLK